MKDKKVRKGWWFVGLATLAVVVVGYLAIADRLDLRPFGPGPEEQEVALVAPVLEATRGLIPEEPVEKPLPGLEERPCRSQKWWEEARADTADVAALISLLDRDFVLEEGGQWSEPGFAVPADSVFWTDLFQNAPLSSEDVHPIRTQGGWGVYFTEMRYEIPHPNGGGRFLRLCQSAEVAQTSFEMTEEDACLDGRQATTILESNSPIVAYDSFYETIGWQFGRALNPGDTAAAGLFLGTFPENDIPEGVENLSEGYVWNIREDIVVPNGGRWMKLCGSAAS